MFINLFICPENIQVKWSKHVSFLFPGEHVNIKYFILNDYTLMVIFTNISRNLSLIYKYNTAGLTVRFIERGSGDIMKSFAAYSYIDQKKTVSW